MKPAAAETRSGSPIVEDPPLLEVRDLAVSFGQGKGARVQAVDGVNFSIYPGQTLGVVGESGCGKSVAAMSLLQLVPAPPARLERGTAMFQTDAGVSDLLALGGRGIRRIRGGEIGMIFQEPMTSLNPVYTVGDQILEAILLHQGVSVAGARAIAVESLAAVGIAEPARGMRSYPHEFSGGMRQRVMIAMALACKPKLLLADEPTTALDVTVQAQVLTVLRDLQRARGMAVMLITHDLGVVAENADVVCVMYAGRVVEYASVNEIFENPIHPYTRGLLACIARIGESRDRLTTVAEVIERPGSFRMPTTRGGRGGVGAEGSEPEPVWDFADARPWWPWHTRPDDLEPIDRPGADSVLQEVAPDHWVGLWSTAALRGRENRPPRLGIGRASARG